MANVKTAISIEEPLFEEVNSLARELNVSRSGLFALAVRDFVERHKNKDLLKSINEVYKDSPETEEKAVAQMRSRHLKMVKDQW